MKLNNRALMMSSGIGLAIRVLFAICIGSAGFAPLLGTAGDVSALAMLGTVGTVLCLCNWIVTLFIGFAYVYFAAKEGPVQPADGAIGGAIATGIAGLVGGLVSACLIVVTPIAVSQGQNVDIAGILGTSVGGLAGAVCGGLLGGAILGAVSGLIGAVTIGKPKA